MKRYTVRFTPEAEDDLLRPYDFLLEKDLLAAERALNAIKAAVELLRDDLSGCLAVADQSCTRIRRPRSTS